MPSKSSRKCIQSPLHPLAYRKNLVLEHRFFHSCMLQEEQEKPGEVVRVNFGPAFILVLDPHLSSIHIFILLTHKSQLGNLAQWLKEPAGSWFDDRVPIIINLSDPTGIDRVNHRTPCDPYVYESWQTFEHSRSVFVF